MPLFFSYGPNFSLKLGVANNLVASMGAVSVTIPYTPSSSNNGWDLITITYNGVAANRLTVFINTVAVTLTTSLFPTLSPSTKATFVIGGGLKGWVDEVRIWDKALTATDILYKSTVSPYHNSYSSLVAYWKCDQSTSAGLVDYSENLHHGQFTPDNSLRQKVTDNTTFRYRPITGYAGLNGIAQGLYNNKELLATSNDIVLFGLDLDTKTGEASFAFPDESGTLTNAEYKESFTAPESPSGYYATQNVNNAISRVARTGGVLHFKGNGAQMNTGNLDFSGNKLTFNTWLYVEQWTVGAALFEKKNAAGDEISLKMGEKDGQFVFTVSALDNAGRRWTEVYPFVLAFKDADNTSVILSTKTATVGFQYWHFLSFVFDGSKSVPVSLAFDAFVQGWPTGGPNFVGWNKTGAMQNGAAMPMDGITDSPVYKIKYLPRISDGNALIGKDLNGYMDEISFWGVDRTTAQRQLTDALDEGLGIGKSGVYYTIQSLRAYYRIMNAETPGKDYMCAKELFDRLLKLLEGNKGYKIRMTIMPDGWQNLMKNQTAREAAVKSLTQILKKENNPLNYEFQGLDTDFEWAEDEATQIGYGAFLAALRKEFGRSKYLSAASNGGNSNWHSFTKEAIDAVDYFTSQDYGPFAVKFTWDSFQLMHSNYDKAGLPKSKMMPSYGIYGVGDVKDQFDSTPYRSFGNTAAPEQNRISKNETQFYNFCGFNQTIERTKFVLEKDCYGMMFFDIPSDLPPTHAKSLTRAMSQVLASNHEPIVNVPNKVNEIDEDAKVNGALIGTYAANSLKATVELTMTGIWSADQVQTLKAAIGGNGSALKTVDMTQFSLATSAVAVLFNPFNSCANLEEIKMPLKEIAVQVAFSTGVNPGGAFQNCKKLKRLDLSKFTNITTLFFVCNGCSQLTEVIIPTSSNYSTSTKQLIASQAFNGCSELRVADLGEDNGKMGLYGAFTNCHKLASVVMPKIPEGGKPSWSASLTPNFLYYTRTASTMPSVTVNGEDVTISGHNLFGNATTGYTSSEAIALDPTQPFFAAKPFTAPSITYTRNFFKTTGIGEAKGWETITLPFTPMKIENDGSAIEPFGNETANVRKFWLASPNEQSGFASAKRLEANQPYILAMPNNAAYDQSYIISGDVVFTGTTVLATPSEAVVLPSKEFDMLPTYAVVAQSASVYALDEVGSKFVANGGAVTPFSAYVVNKPGVQRAPAFYSIDGGNNGTTGIPVTKKENSELQIYTAYGKMIVESTQVTTLWVSSVDGMTRQLRVEEGINSFTLPQGLYIVNGQKVVITQ